MDYTATAEAHPNIAFIKYWGNRDHEYRIPASGSISMNLAGLITRTTVRFAPEMRADRLVLHGSEVGGAALERVRRVLDAVRSIAGLDWRAEVRSENNFPTGAGIASSASAFAALAVAAAGAAGLDLPARDLSRLARLGSGSACRSVPAGFVEWLAGESDADSYAVSIAPPEHWALADCIAIVSAEHKQVGSSAGHRLAETSALQGFRIATAGKRLDACRRAILNRDYDALAAVTELDCHLMHAVMQTSTPRLLYWEPATVAVMRAVIRWRAGGLPVAYTIDAGPNVHVITPAERAEEVKGRLLEIPGVKQVLVATPGGAARLVG